MTAFERADSRDRARRGIALHAAAAVRARAGGAVAVHGARLRRRRGERALGDASRARGSRTSAIERDTYGETLGRHVGPGDLIIDLAWNIGTRRHPRVVPRARRPLRQHVARGVGSRTPTWRTTPAAGAHALRAAHGAPRPDRALGRQRRAVGGARARRQPRPRLALHEGGARRHRGRRASTRAPRERATRSRPRAPTARGTGSRRRSA